MRRITNIICVSSTALMLIFLLLLSSQCWAYIEKTTHKIMNMHIADNNLSFNGFSLNNYLMTQLNIEDGTESIIKDVNIIYLLAEGGEREDAPSAWMPWIRSVNHFHNPLNNKGFNGLWGTDFLRGDSASVFALKPPATQSPGGHYSWQDTRNYYYSALIAIDKETSDIFFANTFRGLGQLMHLVQDMSVPEHARDDGHYIGRNYEKWVAGPKAPKISSYKSPAFFIPDNSVRLSVGALFDSNQYREDNLNPVITLQSNVGLSEYANANFISPDTIFTDFIYPRYSDMEVNIKVMDTVTNDKILYLKKIGNGETIEYFARADNFFNYLPPDFKQLALTLEDDEVYANYADKLIPRAIGYSSQLLGYFFRGKLEVKMLPVFNEDKILDHINLRVRNVSSSQESMSGTKSQFTLTYGYNPEGGAPADGVYSKKIGSINLPKDLPYGKDSAGNDLEGDDYEVEISAYVFPDGIPEERYPSMKFMLSFLGNLGEEKMDFSVNSSGAFNNYGAVIGKAFTAKPIRFFHEEWIHDPTPEYTWFQMESDLFGSNLYNDGIDHGLAENTIEAGRLTKNNVRYAEDSDYQYGPFEGGHFNLSLIGRHLRSGDEFANNVFPIPITKDTYIQFKIDEMSIDPLPAAPADVSTHHQGVELIFNNGYILQLSLNDQYWWDGDKVGYFTFSAGDIIVDNIHDMFKQWDMPISEDFKLDRIAIIQQIGNDLPHNIEYRQQMIVDFFRVIEMEKEAAN